VHVKALRIQRHITSCCYHVAGVDWVCRTWKTLEILTSADLIALLARLDEVRQLAAAIDLGGLGEPKRLKMVRTALAARIRLYQGQLPANKEDPANGEQGTLL
jgi:hypothetical protein